MAPKKGPKAGKKKEEEPVVAPIPVHHKADDGFTLVNNKKKKPEHSENRTSESRGKGKEAPKAPPKPKPAIVLGRNQIRVTKEVPLDSRGRPLHWVIIGNKGETIKWIREQSGGVEVEIPPPGDNRNDYNLVGTPEQIQKATALIEDLFKEEKTANENPGEISTEPVRTITVPAPKLPPRVSDAKTVVAPKLLAAKAAAVRPPPVAVTKTQIPREILSMPLGDRMTLDIPLPVQGGASKHKSRLTEIAEETNTAITFDPNWVSVSGFERNCLIAETKVLSIWGQTKYEVAIPTSRQGEPMLGLVIGPKGSTLAEIREKSGNAFVLMPDDGNGRRLGYVTVYGSPQEVQHSVSVICKKLKIGEEVTQEEPENVLIVDQDFPKERRTGKPVIHLLIGKEGSTIRNISAETGVRIDIPRNVRIPDKYTLRGTEEQIKAAMHLIRREFEESGYDLVMPKTVEVAPKDPYANCIVVR